ncbi:ribosome recycling factor [Patescibacteria group bacterium]|nr:ribosome recycling factor [Patescibacteria group bacterium]
MNIFIEENQEEYKKAVAFFVTNISSLRTGRATAAIFDRVFVNVYGTLSPLNSISSITVSDPKSMIINTWDKSLLKDTEKALTEANLGVSVVNEGDKLRVIFPQMTEENRLHLVKQLNEKHETAKISIRQIRDEIKTSIEKAQIEKEITEDDKFKYLRELEDKTKEMYNELKEIRDKKEADIMTV